MHDGNLPSYAKDARKRARDCNFFQQNGFFRHPALNQHVIDIRSKPFGNRTKAWPSESNWHGFRCSVFTPSHIRQDSNSLSTLVEDFLERWVWVQISIWTAKDRCTNRTYINKVTIAQHPPRWWKLELLPICSWASPASAQAKATR